MVPKAITEVVAFVCHAYSYSKSSPTRPEMEPELSFNTIFGWEISSMATL